MRAIEYDCDGVVTIRMCPAFVSAIGNKPAYWYIMKPLRTWDADKLGWHRSLISTYLKQGLRAIYWEGDQWAISTPKQFSTPEEAYAEWENKVRT